MLVGPSSERDIRPSAQSEPRERTNELTIWTCRHFLDFLLGCRTIRRSEVRPQSEWCRNGRRVREVESREDGRPLDPVGRVNFVGIECGREFFTEGCGYLY
jgi:hypothetical protein